VHKLFSSHDLNLKVKINILVLNSIRELNRVLSISESTLYTSGCGLYTYYKQPTLKSIYFL